MYSYCSDINFTYSDKLNIKLKKVSKWRSLCCTLDIEWWVTIMGVLNSN